MRRTLAISLMLALLVACGGSERSRGAGSAPTVTSLALVVDTNAGEAATISGRLAAVALEGTGGGLSANLLESEQDVLLADPGGRSSCVHLPRAPGGAPIRNIHLAFVPGSVQARLGNGQVQTLEVPSSLVVPMPFVARLAAGRPWLVLRHRQRATWTTGPGGETRWAPRFGTIASDVHPLHDERAVIASVDPGSLSAVAMLPSWGNAAATLQLGAARRLRRGGAELTPQEFAAALAPGAEIELVDAVVRGIDEVMVLAADDAPPQGQLPGSGSQSRARGAIARLFPAAGAFDLQIREVHVAGAGFPAPTVPLRVLVDAATEVGWIARAGTPPSAIGYGDLRPGMLVDIEWSGAPAQGRVRAERVAVRALMRGALQIPIAERVQSVDVVNNIVVLEPASGTEIHWQGGTVATLVIALTPDALLLRRNPPEVRLASIAELAPGDGLLVFAQPSSGNAARAALAVAAAQ